MTFREEGCCLFLRVRPGGAGPRLPQVRSRRPKQRCLSDGPEEKNSAEKRINVEKQEFMKMVYCEVKKELGESCKVEVKAVKKNNGVAMHGLMIYTGNRNIVPTIYLDSFWEAYKSGQSFAAVVRQLLKLYREQMPGKDVDMDFFRSFDKVKERICYRLIRQKGNEELLQESPHIEFLDLALCFFYAYDGQIGEGTIRIKNAHAQRWGVKTADLVRFAEQNTARIFRWQCVSMEDIIREDPELYDAKEEIREDMKKDFSEGNSMKILTNTKRIYGAVCMLYPGVLEKLAEKEQKSLYILPSSVHEVILLPRTGIETPGDLRRMILDVNSTFVAPEEVLSDNLYYYDFVEKKVKIIY